MRNSKNCPRPRRGRRRGPDRGRRGGLALAALSLACAWGGPARDARGEAEVPWTGSLVTTTRLPSAVSPTGTYSTGWSDVTPPSGGVRPQIAVPQNFRIMILTVPPGFVLVPSGRFDMGNSFAFEGTPDELPVHKVDVDTFYMEAKEVSMELWTAVRDWAVTNGYDDLCPGRAGYSTRSTTVSNDHPVTGISWYDCVKWCNARSEMQGLTPVYHTDAVQTQAFRRGCAALDERSADWRADGFRLPTEAEWEHAARGGLRGKRYPGGTDSRPDGCNYADSGDPFDNGTIPGGYFQRSNAFGLHDMGGNVQEWCWDWFGPYFAARQRNPRGPAEGVYRILRGGSWSSPFAFSMRCSYRHYNAPHQTDNTFGLRCVRRL
jgi:formylglycine-generating enzyme